MEIEQLIAEIPDHDIDVDSEIGKGKTCPFGVDARAGEISVAGFAGLTIHSEREAAIRRTLGAGPLERGGGHEQQRDGIIEIDRHRMDAPPNARRDELLDDHAHCA
jgi:hypothetical protein